MRKGGVVPYRRLVESVIAGDKEAARQVIELIGEQRKKTAIRLLAERSCKRGWRNTLVIEQKKVIGFLKAWQSDLESFLSDDFLSGTIRVHLAKRRALVRGAAFPGGAKG